MWESPIYKFKRNGKKGDSEEIITIDVTGSAPSMSTPGEYLESVFSTITNGKSPKHTHILDFGAAKLRNTLYLLKKGFNVYSVEFPELSDRMPQAKKNWEEAKAYKNFFNLIFPRDFYKLDKKMDIALFINVLNVMPVPIERLSALALCRNRMKEDGVFFWFNWKPVGSNPNVYNNSTRINDGWFVGKRRDKKTFHVEWSREEAFETLFSTGYSECKDIDIEKTASQSYLFRANQPILLDNVLQLNQIEQDEIKSDSDKVEKEFNKINFLKLYMSELKTIESNREDARKYAVLISRLLAQIFNKQLKNPKIEKPIDDRLGFIDTVFQNRNNHGFFKNAKEMHDIKCPWLIVECKNYSEDISNPDVDQLAGRMDNPDRGQLGILACRKNENHDRIIERCRAKLKKNKYIIVLEDKDFERLVKFKIDQEEDDEEIDDFMEEKLSELID